jgi:hypothetical protein
MQFQENTPYDVLTEKWNPVLNHAALAPIGDDYRKKVTAVLLENQEQAIRTQHLTEDMTSNNFGGPASASGYNQGQVSGYDPVLISLVRRSMPNLMAYDICGVQPMTAPTGLIFAMRTQYGAGGGTYGNIGTGGTGGSGGGGVGGATDTTAGTAGTTNSGSGGGGGGSSTTPGNGAAGGAGGKGVVILSVPTANYSSTTTGSPTVTTSGSNTIMQFNGSGSYTT